MEIYEPSEGKKQMSPDSEKNTKKVSRNFSKRAVYSATGILIIILYWLFYAWQETLANMGDYRYFSYQLHEITHIGTFIFPILTLLWMFLHIRCMKQNRTWKNGLFFLSILFLLLCGQFGFLHQRSKLIAVSCIATVKEKPSDNCVVICCEEREIRLSTTPAVVNLLQTDGTEYCFLYDTYKDNREEGTLCTVVLNSSNNQENTD